MSDGPSLLRTNRHECGLSIHRRNIEDELDPELPDSIDDGVDIGIMVPGLELDDTGLGHPQLLGQGSLTQVVLRAVSQKGRGELPGRRESLPLRFEAGVCQLLFRNQRVEVSPRSCHLFLMIIDLLSRPDAAPETLTCIRHRLLELLLLRCNRQDHEPLPEPRVYRPGLAGSLLWP